MTDGIPLLQWTNLLIIPGLLVGFTVHDLAHAITAYLLGDYSQVENGKIKVPTGPGMGIEIDPDFIKKHQAL